MKLVSWLAAVITLLGTMPVAARAQTATAGVWRVSTVRRCPRADTLFGRQWRSRASVVRVRYSQQMDTTMLLTGDRRVGWRQAGSSRLVGSEAIIRLPGQYRWTNDAQIDLSLRFIDSIFRAPEQAPVSLQIDRSLQVEIPEPRIDYVTVPGVRGVPIVVSFLLSPEHSRALAGARDVRGTMGPFSFFLYDWELWDINAIYRASFCGLEGGVAQAPRTKGEHAQALAAVP